VCAYYILCSFAKLDNLLPSLVAIKCSSKLLDFTHLQKRMHLPLVLTEKPQPPIRVEQCHNVAGILIIPVVQIRTLFLADLTNYFDGYSKKFGYSSENCFYAILSAACFWCDPDSGNFSSNSNTDIYICSDWCQSVFMPACNKTLQLTDSFCSSPHAVNDTYSQGLVTVNWGNNPDTSTCFSPAPVSQVNSSKCATNYSFTDWGEIIAVVMTVCSFIFDAIVLVALTTFGIMWAIKKRRDEASFLKN